MRRWSQEAKKQARLRSKEGYQNSSLTIILKMQILSLEHLIHNIVILVKDIALYLGGRKAHVEHSDELGRNGLDDQSIFTLLHPVKLHTPS